MKLIILVSLILVAIPYSGVPCYATDTSSPIEQYKMVAAGDETLLAGLSGFLVAIAVSKDLADDGLTENFVRTKVELRLRSSGISIYQNVDSDLWIKKSALLVVEINGRNSPVDGPLKGVASCYYTISILEPVMINRNGKPFLAETWVVRGNAFESADKVKDIAIAKIGDAIDSLANSYLKVNPKDQQKPNDSKSGK